MSKRFIVAEQQIKRLMGENFMSYLEKTNDAEETSPIEYGTEVFTNGKDANDDDTDSPCTDRIAKERYPRNPFSYWHSTRGYALGGTVVTEDNQELKNRQFSLNSSLKKNVQANASGSNDRLLNNMANETSFNIKTAYKRKYDLENMMKNDPNRFKSINGARLLKDITSQIESAKGISKSSKEAKKNAGMQNVYQKAGGTKTYGNGKAHSKKNSPTIIPNK